LKLRLSPFAAAPTFNMNGQISLQTQAPMPESALVAHMPVMTFK
jgi:hypothetical protein